MRHFFYLSGTLFFLAMTLLVSLHLRPQTAVAQVGGQTVAAAISNSESGLVITQEGDVYFVNAGGGSFSSQYRGNLFTGAVVTQPTTWGNLKQKFVK